MFFHLFNVGISLFRFVIDSRIHLFDVCGWLSSSKQYYKVPSPALDHEQNDWTYFCGLLVDTEY